MALIGFIKSAINLLATALGDSEINNPLDQNHPINHNGLRSELKLQEGLELKAVGIGLHQFPLALSATKQSCSFGKLNTTVIYNKVHTPSTQGMRDVTKLKCSLCNQQTCLRQRCYSSHSSCSLEDSSAVYGALIP